MKLMFRHARQPKILLKNTVHALLLITLSGVYCLLCAPSMSAAVAAEKHCPISKVERREHCDFSKNQQVAEESRTATGINSFACCGPRFNFFVAKLEKNEFPQQASALVNSFFGFPGTVKPARVASQTGFTYRAPVFASRDLHIKNCVFRI